MPVERLNLLLVGCHPKDMFNHCGATLSRHARRGDHVTVVSLTHGLRAHDVVIAEQLRFQEQSPNAETVKGIMQTQEQVKNAEVMAAADVLGIHDVRFLGQDDSIVLVTHELIQAVACLIREIKPHIVLTHYPLEGGGVADHHANTGKITLYAIQAAANVWPGDPNPGYRVAQVFFMTPEAATFRSTVLAGAPPTFCDYYVDVGDLMELKVRALSKLQSCQVGGNRLKKGLEAWNGKDGNWMGVAYAEGFVRYWPEIGNYLPVSKERLERANEPEKVGHERMNQLTVPFVQLPEDPPSGRLRA